MSNAQIPLEFRAIPESVPPGSAVAQVSVFVQWLWTYATGQLGSRLIVNHHGPSSRDSPAAEADHAPSIIFHEPS
jgi:hypothetical protein